MTTMKDVECLIEVLSATFRADLTAGRLWWKERPVEHFLIERDARATNKKKAGREVGSYRHHGSHWVKFRYLGVLVQTSRHRVIWALANGRWPEGEIDHIHGHEAGDGIDNLREATHQQNLQNMTAARKNNTSGVVGVCWVGEKYPGKPWKAAISVQGKTINLGQFATMEEASAAYSEARRKHFTFSPELR